MGGHGFCNCHTLVYYAMNKWLQNFCLQNELSWWVFSVVGGCNSDNYTHYRKLAKLESGNTESGRVIEV
jgi:hypothetical protein